MYLPSFQTCPKHRRCQRETKTGRESSKVLYIYIYIGQIRLSRVTIYICPTLSLIRSKVYSVFNYKERRFAIGAKPLRVGGRSRTDCLDVSYISEYKSLISTGERKTRQKGAEGGGEEEGERSTEPGQLESFPIKVLAIR